MKRSVVLLCALAGFGCGPIWMLPGGELSGETKPHPRDWKFSDAVETVQLETRPDDPYSVNIWGVGVGEHFYIGAGDPSNEWVAGIAEDSDVRLKLGDSIFELNAVRTNADAEIEGFLAGLQRKYDFEPDPDQRGEAIVFRLEPRANP